MRKSSAFVAAMVIVGVLTGAPSTALAESGQGKGGKGAEVPDPRNQPKAKPTKALANLIKVTSADLQDYWAEEMPAVYGQEYQPVEKVVPYTSKKLPRCGGEKIGLGNAFYCRVTQLISYDNEEYYPEIFRDLGPIAVQVSLAHEWGHAIQDQVGVLGTVPTIITELQADCFAGAWGRRVQDGGSSRLEFGPAERDTFAARVLRVADPVGFSPDDPRAHGTAFDRVNALGEGFESGNTRCAEFIDSPPPIVEIPFASEEDFNRRGKLPAEEIIPLLVQDLNGYWGPLVGPDLYIPLSQDVIVGYDSDGPQNQLPTCDGPLSKDFLTDRVFVCITDQYLAFDAPYLGSVYDNLGDYAVATLIADTWSTAVQFMNGLQAETTESILQAHCLTGAWAGAAFFGQRETAFKDLSPGDLDEVVAAVMVSQRGADTSTGAVVFPLIQAFQIGFYDGLQKCLGG